MRPHSFRWGSNAWRVGLILLAVTISLAAGGSYLVWGSSLAPLFVGVAVVAAAFGIACLQKPAWALYVAVFWAFLPIGLIPRDPYYRLVDLILILALLYWVLNVSLKRRRIVWVSTILLMGFFLVWSVVTVSWATHLVEARWQLIRYADGLILVLLLVNEIDSRQTLDGLMRTLALNGWVAVLAGVATVLLQGYLLGTRLMVREMNTNEFGVLLIVTMPGVLWQAMQAPKRWKALTMSLSVVFILLALVLVALSGSRGSAISLLVTLILFWFWKPTRRWGNFGLLILAVGVVSTPFIFSNILERFGEAEGGTLGGRIPLWQAAWQLIGDHFWGGVGIGNAPDALAPYARLLRSLGGAERIYTHNPVLQVWAETGVLGMLLYLGVLVSAVWLFIRQYFYLRMRRVRFLIPYFALVSSTFAGYMLSWIKGGGMEHALSYFLMLALLLIPSRLDIEGSERITENDV